MLLAILVGLTGAGFLFNAAHRVQMLLRWRAHRNDVVAAEPPKVLPRVTVQLPIYNEITVVERLIDAAARIDYPAGKLEIQVLDDSTDGTGEIAMAAVRRWRERGVSIGYIHREKREGFKAGALARGLNEARGELIAIFDADFLPPSDFLLRTVGHFDDPAIGMVQARWAFLNERESSLTMAQGLSLRAHFRIEHFSRNRSGCFFNFNGTAGIWRAEAIRDAGGWQADTLTEDLDLSYRAQLRGWKFVYRDDIACLSELPPVISSFKAQQFRWMKGMAQVARRLLPRILAAPLPLRVKAEACAHLLAPVTFACALAAFLLLLPLSLIAGAGDAMMTTKAFFGGILFASTAVLFVFHAAADRDTSAWRGWGDYSLRFLFLLMVGIGNSLNATRAVVEGALGIDSPFVRTPKRGDAKTVPRRPAYRLAPDRFIIAEVILAGYAAALLVISFCFWPPMIPWSALFFSGWLMTVRAQFQEFAVVRRSGR